MAHYEQRKDTDDDVTPVDDSVLSETSFTQISLLDDFHTRSSSPTFSHHQQQQQQEEDKEYDNDDNQSINSNNDSSQLLETSFTNELWMTKSPLPMEPFSTSDQQQQNFSRNASPGLDNIPFEMVSSLENEGDVSPPLPATTTITTTSKPAITTPLSPKHTRRLSNNNNLNIDTSLMATPTARPAHTTGQSAAQLNRRSTTLTLKDQEKTIDTLKKENFGLKMKIYYLEKRLDELSPDQNDLAIRENIDLKVNIQTLGQELKKYKNMILELNQAMAMLQQQPCPQPHGMSEEEQLEYENALTSADAYRLENDQLQKLVSEQRMENARLRLICSQKLGNTSSASTTGLNGSNNNSNNVIRSQSSSTSSSSSLPGIQQQNQNRHLQQSSLSPSSSSSATPSSSSSSNKDKEMLERYKKSWMQAKQTIQDQNNTIQQLRDTLQRTTLASSSASSTSSSAASLEEERRRGNNNRRWLELEQSLTHTRERNRDLLTKLRQKSNETDRLRADRDDLANRIEELKQQLHDKSLEYDELILQMDEQQHADDRNNSSNKKAKKLLQQQYNDLEQNHRALQLDYADMEEQRYADQQKAHRLQSELEQREHDLETLEEEMVKLVAHAEDLEKQLEENKQALEQQQQESARRLDEEKQQLMHAYLQQDELVNGLETKFSTLMTKALEQKQEHYRQREAELINTHTRVQDEAKQRYEDDLQLLEVKFNQVEQSIRERDVRIAALEGHLEAQTDATDREKLIYQEEIKELEAEVQQLTTKLKELEHQREEDYQNDDQQERDQSVNHQDTLLAKQEELETQIQSLQEHLQEADDRLKRDRHAANQALNDYMKSQHLLQQKLDAVRKRNELLTSLLDQYQNPSEGNGKRLDKATRLLTKLNQELHQELEERDRHLEMERNRAQQLDELYAQALSELGHAEQQLIRRDNMITRALERIESDKERKEVLENVLRRQATEDLEMVLRTSLDSTHSLVHS